MAGLAAGKRLKSTVCNTEIMVIAAPGGEVDLTCGGAPMSADGAGNGGNVAADFAEGTTLGKRYTNEEGHLRYDWNEDGIESFWESRDFSDPNGAARTWVVVLMALLMDQRYLHL